MQKNCSGKSRLGEHGGECFEDDSLCPQITFCGCPVCFYGAQCQLSADGFSLSLDTILGYHIRPNANIPASTSYGSRKSSSICHCDTCWHD